MTFKTLVQVFSLNCTVKITEEYGKWAKTVRSDLFPQPPQIGNIMDHCLAVRWRNLSHLLEKFFLVLGKCIWISLFYFHCTSLPY